MNHLLIPVKKLFLLVMLSLLISFSSKGQLSYGGKPIALREFKSVSALAKVVKMPPFVQSEIPEHHSLNEKSLKFAHAFDVCLNPENSGNWIEQDGYRIWQLAIESAGAYSINLVFGKYQLPVGARLFIISEDRKFVLGAFTHENNKYHKQLGVSPVPGDRLLVQYEEPLEFSGKAELEISKVAHAYLDVLSMSNRWPRRNSGSCNINVNCEFDSGLEKERRSVIRIYATDELGTGTLINNLNHDGKPYVISALHVFDNPKGAQSAVFDFNYESPFCTNLEGFDLQTLSGSQAIATFDSLDLLLVELNEMPPASFRPYWAGWDARKIPPSDSWCIHHPNGDTKKISHDAGTCDSTRYSSNYIRYGSWKVHNWEMGTTEFGSSGAGLFLRNGKFVGVLHGGAASCTSISYDLFTRFDKLFSYNKEPGKQLKYWLDPMKTNVLECDGFDYYNSSAQSCNLVSNFQKDDQQVAMFDTVTEKEKSWLTGNNGIGITEVAEKFAGFKSCYLSGVALGIARKQNVSQDCELLLKVYSGTNQQPDDLLKEYRFPMKYLMQNAMNYLSFPETLYVEGNFFIGIVLPDNQDSLVLFHSMNRPVFLENTLLFRKNGKWLSSAQVLGESTANMALLLQSTICSAILNHQNDTVNENKPFATAYPIPVKDVLKVVFRQNESRVQLLVFDLLGRKMLEHGVENASYSLLDLGTLLPGMYFLVARNEQQNHVQRIIVGAK